MIVVYILGAVALLMIVAGIIAADHDRVFITCPVCDTRMACAKEKLVQTIVQSGPEALHLKCLQCTSEITGVLVLHPWVRERVRGFEGNRLSNERAEEFLKQERLLREGTKEP